MVFLGIMGNNELLFAGKQTEDPQITLWKEEYTVGERLEVNCTSGASKPTPEVTWLLNGRQVVYLIHYLLRYNSSKFVTKYDPCHNIDNQE